MKERVFYTIEVRDREGKLLRHFTRRSHSFVRQWNQIVNVQCKGTALAITDVGNVSRNVNQNTANLIMTGGAGSVAYGIVVGTGSTAVTINDYCLASRCEEGTGLNQLNYQAGSVAAAAVSGSDCAFTVTRSAINNSGATIAITEIGIQVIGDAGGNYYFLGIRDVLGSAVNVPDGGAITVVYTLKVTV